MSTGFEIILLLAVAAVLLIRLIGTLGKRDGFEPEMRPAERPKTVADAKVVDAQEDFDLEHYGADERIKAALSQAKQIEPDFRVDEFLRGSKSAYEMILMSFLKGDMNEVSPFVDENVLAGFNHAIAEREAAGETIDAHFGGISNVELRDAEFDPVSKELTLSVDYVADLSRVVRNKDGEVISGDKNKMETEYDKWQYARVMGSPDPNWTLVATGE